MNITVIGAGYVGLVTAVCFAELGNSVTCVDANQDKIDQLKKAEMPVYEPGLQALVKSGLNEKRLHFVTALSEQKLNPQVIFIAVGTPSGQDGSADMQYVLRVAKDIGDCLREYCVVVDKSTVPVGVADQVAHIVRNCLEKRGLKTDFDMVSNPEFLREGGAIEDFMHPDRIVIGLDSERARGIMQALYTPLLRHPEKMFFMPIRDAEMTKYAANAMLATRISFMNEMAILSEKMHVDIENVRLGIGVDRRIGPDFLNAGCGYGGSCFPKDVKALIRMAEEHAVDPMILRAVEERNFYQKQLLAEKIFQRFGRDLSGVHIAVWGLSFKPDTDDLREASSITLLQQLISNGATVHAYDPVAMAKAQKFFPKGWFLSGRLIFASHQYEALTDVDALALVTEWKSFCYPDLPAMLSLMRQKIVFDGRNQYNPDELTQAGFEYFGIGRAQKLPVDDSKAASVCTEFLQTLTYDK